MSYENFNATSTESVEFLQAGGPWRDDFQAIFVAYSKLKPGQVLIIEPVEDRDIQAQARDLRSALSVRADKAGIRRPSVRRTRDGKIGVLTGRKRRG
jgi:hypothetical protein